MAADKYPIKQVYIRQSAAEVGDFLKVLEDGFQRHHIDTKVITGEPPTDSDYFVTYSATEDWDMGRFLEDATIRLKQGTNTVATAVYHCHGFDFRKWGSTASKIDPVIDQLLAGFPR